MAPLNSFNLQYLCQNQFIFCFQTRKHHIEKHFLLLISQDLHSFMNTTSITQLLKIGICSKSKVTRNIFNRQELHQNMQKSEYLFQQIFIVYKTFTMGMKTKNLPRTTIFCLWSFYKDDHVSKKTTFEWFQEWLSYTGLTVLVGVFFRMSHFVFLGYLVFKLTLLKVNQNILIPNFKRMEAKDEIFQIFWSGFNSSK